MKGKNKGGISKAKHPIRAGITFFKIFKTHAFCGWKIMNLQLTLHKSYYKVLTKTFKFCTLN
jgi:hypothetical protein